MTKLDIDDANCKIEQLQKRIELFRRQEIDKVVKYFIGLFPKKGKEKNNE